MIQKIYHTDFNDGMSQASEMSLYISSVGSSVLESDFTGAHEKSCKDYRLLYLYHGDISIKSGKKIFTLSSGQMIIFPPNTPYAYKNIGKNKIEYLWMNFGGTQAEKLIKSVFLQISTPLYVGIPEYIFEAFETLYAEYEIKTPFFETAMVYKLMHIMVLLGRASEKFGFSITGKNKKNQNLGFLSTSVKYIRDNFTEEIPTEKLAAMEHLSVSHFRRLFKYKTGMTPTQYLTITRLKNAEELLLKTDMNIKQVASSVGFDNQLYFSKLFTKHYGKSPKNYR